MNATGDPPGEVPMHTLVGRTIVAADRSEDEHSQGGDAARLTLDDGRVIRFGGWGHDWWGLNVDQIDG